MADSTAPKHTALHSVRSLWLPPSSAPWWTRRSLVFPADAGASWEHWEGFGLCSALSP